MSSRLGVDVIRKPVSPASLRAYLNRQAHAAMAED